ncbi:MAG: IS1182 family transposase [Actinomycetota bacterium]|nr:IS1182 family transposase [Actinomycetota bacterium]
MAREFLPYDLDQQYLLPPSMREWVPEGHLIWFISDLVDSLDLSAILSAYEKDDMRGRAGYHPVMMTKLLLYAYAVGKPSSRKIERACWEDVSFRVLSGDRHPDHTSVSEFRRHHLKALAGLFVQVLVLCRETGLVKLGHVALDGTKVKANASKHKAMSYGRMCKTEKELAREVARLLEEAERVDAQEDARYGDARGDELPEELRRRESRLAKIREAKAALEAKAKEEARAEAEAARERCAERERKEADRGKKFGGRPPAVPDPEAAVPRDKDQRNFTDPESRIMKDGATGSFVQAYNAHAAVDEEAQVIVAASVTQQANDKLAFLPLLDGIESNLGALPDSVTADAGFFSESNLSDPRFADVKCYVPPEKRTRTPLADTMREKLASEVGEAIYRKRKAIVEPVFGQIKEARGFRRFSFRGLASVDREWRLMCLTSNMLKLYRAGARPNPA